MKNIEKLNKIAMLAEYLARKDRRERYTEVDEIYKSLHTLKDLADEVIKSIEFNGLYDPDDNPEDDLDDLFKDIED